MSMTVEDLKDAVCKFVNIAEEHVERKYFEELDNKGAAIIVALDEFRELKEKAMAKKKDVISCPICGGVAGSWSEGKG